MSAPARSALDDLEVIVDPQLDVDAGLAGRILVLRPGQTHENAVLRLAKMFPAEHIDDIQRLVRKHMPDAPSLESLDVQLAAATPKWVTGPTPEHAPTGFTRRKMRILTAIIGTAVGVASLSCYVALTRMQQSPLDSPEFQTLATAANFDCQTIDATTASCVSLTERTTWTVTARKGTAPLPDSYRFSSEGKVAVVWVFESAQDRETSPEIEGVERSYPFTSSRDRVTVSATDVPVLAAMAHAVDKSVLHGLHGKPETTPAVDAPGRNESAPAWPLGPSVTPVPWPDPTPGSKPGSTPRSTSAVKPYGDSVTPAPTVSVTAPTPKPTRSSPTGTPAPADGKAQSPAAGADEPKPVVSVTVTIPADPLDLGG